ncbi:serine/threonine-protein kinase pim-1-like [Poecile atricapillus]|uniref:serine/threonine-protein kinase pim-1-like n=1 Tax=Poecile atricapillus TaxID=48891 RepID=UPI002739E837|nr:serine/threonine-protein kinase pim-1-like [Poecile atricapillus]
MINFDSGTFFKDTLHAQFAVSLSPCPPGTCPRPAPGHGPGAGPGPDRGPGRPVPLSPPPGSSRAGAGASGRASVPGAGAVSSPFGSACFEPCPGPGKAQEALQQRYRIGTLLGRGGFGRVFLATRLSDGAPVSRGASGGRRRRRGQRRRRGRRSRMGLDTVAIKKVPRNRIRRWGELPDGSSAPLEIVLLDKVSTGFSGVVQLLEWFELPKHIVMVLERPERCEDLRRYIRARIFLSEEEARELFRQVLEAVRHCTSCRVLHRDIKPENILVDLDTGEAKLIDFGCGTYLQDTAYTQFAGTRSYRPPEWTNFGWYHGEAATVWTLGILLHEMVCGKHPFRRGWNISWGHLLLPQQLSQVTARPWAEP